MAMRMITVGIMADPGLPVKVAHRISEDLPRALSERSGPEVSWEVEVSRETLPLTAQGEIPLIDRARQLRERYGWDCVVYLTDLPRAHDQEPMVCELSSTARAALVCLPALGAYRLRARTRKLLVTLVQAVEGGTEDFPSTAAVWSAVGYRVVRRAPSPGGGDTSYVVLSGRANRLRLLAGMVRSNRPGRLLPALSSCVAAAAATGAFGIFYASIWNMSDALSPARLAGISVVVIAALSGWLIAHNGLWNNIGDAADRWRAGLDNASTVITVGLSVALMYLVLWAVLFVVGVAVIAADYLQSQLGHPVNLLDYGHLSWLAASLGTLAGALGSNFDSDEAIREASYSRREHQRRKLAHDYQD